MNNEHNSPAWVQELREKSFGDLQTELVYLETMTEALTRLFRAGMGHIDIYIDKPGSFEESKNFGVLKNRPPHLRLTFTDGNCPEQFKEFIHNYCTWLCAKKLVVETLVGKK